MEKQSYDVVIVGAGPAGLCFAASIRPLGLRVAIVEKLGADVLADPPYDGREIALTRKSLGLLRELGVLEKIPADQVSPMQGARVMNGVAARSLEINSRDSARLGALVSNHDIRRAAFATAMEGGQLALLAGVSVEAVGSDPSRAWVRLDDGRELSARLVVAADSRFSSTRRSMGIPARHQDFGKTMLVCRMEHTQPHEQVAWEWFGREQTLAVLPLNGNRSSIVLTLPHTAIQRVLAMDAAAFASEMESRFMGRLGRMTLASERFAYPLVGVYPERLVARRFAAIGDAAVGMHPVTAHGFNFGLLGQATLAKLLGRAVRHGTDIGGPLLLRHYELEHRHATYPLYAATNAVVRLYTNDALPARVARGALLQAASRFRPVGAVLSHLLSQDSSRPRLH
jgi:ubiquinone biosynthesis UbiH/UbiF/VisC/COQ6 family hydroxylase